MRRDLFRDFDLAGRGVFDFLVQVLVLDVEFGGDLDFRVGVGIRVRRRHGGRGGGFVLFPSSVLPSPPGESDRVLPYRSFFSERVYFATLLLSAQSLSWVTRKRGRVVGISSWKGRVTLLGMPRFW